MCVEQSPERQSKQEEYRAVVVVVAVGGGAVEVEDYSIEVLRTAKIYKIISKIN